MSTIFDIRNMRLPRLSRASVIIGSLVVVLAIVAFFVGRELYQKLTNNTVVAYFPETNGLYAGDRVQIMGVKVGTVDKIEPAGDKMKVTFHYSNKYKVPANASAVILNPTLVAARNIQLTPAYKGGPVLADNAVIPIERTQVPTEYDQLRNSITNIISKLGPTKEQPKGPFGDVIESFADGLAGKGKQINTTFDSLSRALTALNEGRGDFFAVVRSLALFVNALHQDDQQFVALNQNLAQFTDNLVGSDRDLANAIQQFDSLLATLRPFLDKNREVLTHDINNLATATTALVQPDPLNGLETGLHVLPTGAANVNQIYHPSHGAVVAVSEIQNFANPMQFICSAIQAGSRAGYQESAELCAQYLAPILDAIKFNYLPFGLNLFSTAETLPKEVAYSEPRLQPPNGYKDTTVPGIWVPDTPTSHRNTQHGWVVAPGMQGTQVGPITAGLMTPESLAELMGGPDIAPPQSGLQTPPGPPNAYDEYPVVPPIGLQAPQVPIPPPPPGPEVAPAPGPPPPAPRGEPGLAPAASLPGAGRQARLGSAQTRQGP
ncbi:virulence factor Mce family protein [uncultured Mycobacterium sp.]|uniref:virulence factor Mce family protein n=1 Tax=uncultured Mycobacterium sp. TaxID=171292 RepID=UPI0035C9E7BC